MSSVYLAGPISGLSYDDCTNWRDVAAAELELAGIKALSPMRWKSYLADVTDMSPTCSYGDRSPLSGPRGVMTRDRFDATRCDVMLVNLLGAERVSIGTVMEIAWADLCRTPIVCAIEPGNVHAHSMIDEAVGFRTASLAEAVAVVRAILQ